jgi:predicted ester cyclase/uncharacterized protein YndB with AHSA1/START domain
MYNIDHTIEISATPATILGALTTKEGTKAWFTDDVDCDAAKREATFRFLTQAGLREVAFHLDSADERGVAMSCIAERNNPEWLGTKLSYELSPMGVGTRVRLVHAGFAAKSEAYDSTVKGWAYFLGSLKQYVETGVGTPYQRNKAIVERWEEQFKNEANVAITDELMAPNFVHQLPLPGLPPGREGLKAVGRAIFAAFAHEHLKVKIEHIVATGDRVVTRTRVRAVHTGEFNGIPATRREVGWTELTMFRLEDGKIVEMIGEGNFLGLVAQLTAK